MTQAKRPLVRRKRHSHHQVREKTMNSERICLLKVGVINKGYLHMKLPIEVVRLLLQEVYYNFPRLPIEIVMTLTSF